MNNEFDAILGRLNEYNKDLKSNRRARRFLEKRGFDDIDNLIHRFKIGSSSIRNDYFDGYIVFPVFYRKRLKHMTARFYDREVGSVIKHLHLYNNIQHYFNHDMIFKADWLIIVESPICALSLCSYGYPAIAALGQGKTPDHYKDITKHHEIIIINDADKNKAGIDGALKQAAMLKNRTNHIKIGRLPLIKGTDKTDVNDYFKKLNRSDFEDLIEDTIHYAEPYRGEKKETRRGRRGNHKGDSAWRNDYDIAEILGEFSNDFVEEGNHYIGYCPLHDDVNGKSFVVYPDTDSWSCLGKCRTGGDVAKFFMLKYDMGFPEALRFLRENYK